MTLSDWIILVGAFGGTVFGWYGRGWYVRWLVNRRLDRAEQAIAMRIMKAKVCDTCGKKFEPGVLAWVNKLNRCICFECLKGEGR